MSGSYKHSIIKNRQSNIFADEQQAIENLHVAKHNKEMVSIQLETDKYEKENQKTMQVIFPINTCILNNL